TCSRSASAVSPRPKSNGGIALGIMSLSCLSGFSSLRVVDLDVDAYELPFAVGRDEGEVEVDPQRLGWEVAFHQEPALVVDLGGGGVARFQGGEDVEVDVLLVEFLDPPRQPLDRVLLAERLGELGVEDL